MEITNVCANTLDEAWHLSIKGLFEESKTGIHSYTIDRGSYEGHKRIEYDYLVLLVRYPEVRPLAPIVPEGFPPPTTEDKILEYFNRYITSDMREPNEQYTYGERIIVSLQMAIDILEKTPMTNQAIIEIACPEDINLSDPPCMRLIDIRRSNDNNLHLFPNFRSWDIFSGMPVNLGGIQLLKEYMCRELGCIPGMTIATSKGAHLYDFQIDIAKTKLGLK